MATVVVEATEPEPSGSIANPAASTSPSLSHRFLDSKFYLLVVVGETVTEEHLRRAIGNIELGKQPRAPRDARRETRKHDPTQGATATLFSGVPRTHASPPTLDLDPFLGLFQRIIRMIRFKT
jgi:hypothetical protein